MLSTPGIIDMGVLTTQMHIVSIEEPPYWCHTDCPGQEASAWYLGTVLYHGDSCALRWQAEHNLQLSQCIIRSKPKDVVRAASSKHVQQDLLLCFGLLLQHRAPGVMPRLESLSEKEGSPVLWIKVGSLQRHAIVAERGIPKIRMAVVNDLVLWDARSALLV